MMKYVDRDGDKIAVSSQLEWDEILHELEGQEIYKIYIEPMNELDLKDMSGSTPSHHVVSGNNNVLNNRDGNMMNNMVNNFVSSITSSMDPPARCYMLQKKALQCLSSGDKSQIEKGREYLLESLAIIPDDKVTLYNLTCAESLLGNIECSLNFLDRSIDHGYKNLEHILVDPDLENIRNDDGFAIIMSKLEHILWKNEEETYHTTNEEYSEPDLAYIENNHDDGTGSEEKLKLLSDLFNDLPKDVLQQLLEDCDQDVEKVIETLSH